ncbi:T-cell surface protein tactile [Sciurus carolinensis]|uniref:T-cell surface protein tactile n=1 Tax=Sciurus carolinensis TaxID=30640 RepID=UPI001FB2AE29|nr:T-cell surface protein tactile [Sciurus carolinensis]
MERKWTYCAVYSIIQIQFVRGVWEEGFNAREDVFAVPGSDVNMTCQTQLKGLLVQMQWSKITDKMELIALYHPQYGLHCAHGHSCKSLVAFREIPENIMIWTLLLRNVSLSLSGKYECSFTLYPEGIWTKNYELLVQNHIAQDEWRSNHTIEIEINQTLEMPCFQNSSSETSSEFTFTWLVEDNGAQEMLIQDHHISSSTSFKDRVKLCANYGLCLSPVQIHDDGRQFSCQVRLRSGKILRSSTTVKVFAKPEIPMIVENSTMNVLGERIFTCSLKNVFPKASLTWFIDGRLLQGEEEGIYITKEERKGKNGFLELKSILTRMHGSEPVQSNNLTIWCMALSPVPGNKMWNTSSEEITFFLGSVNVPAAIPPNVTDAPLSPQPSPASSESPTRYPAAPSVTPGDVSASTPHAIPQTVSWIPSETYSSSPSGVGSTLRDDVFTSTTSEFSEAPTSINGSTNNNHIHITSIVVNKPAGRMSWPLTIAALLFFCMALFGLGVRKWCQYQKEIMERPPPFKPPPPPIKYTCIQEPIGSDLPCHEMETL